MLSRRIKSLFPFFFISIGLILILYYWSAKTNKNEFRRLFPSHVLLDEKVTDLAYNSYYIAGKTKKTIYLGNYVTPDYITEFLPSAALLKHFRVHLNSPEKLKSAGFILSVDSPMYFLTEGNEALLFRSEFPDLQLESSIGHSLPHFSLFCPISSTSFLLRSYNPQKATTTISKIYYSPYKKIEILNILQKQVDGIFCTDGMMGYDPVSHKFVYIYYYRNQFTVTDSDLHIIYRGTTIDSNSTVKFTVSSFDQHKTTIISSPQRPINKRLVLDHGNILVQSGLVAKNENAGILNRYAVVDVYAMNDGHYRFSFYIPNYNGEQVRDFSILNDDLISLCGHFLIHYHLNMPDPN